MEQQTLDHRVEDLAVVAETVASLDVEVVVVFLVATVVVAYSAAEEAVVSLVVVVVVASVIVVEQVAQLLDHAVAQKKVEMAITMTISALPR